MNLYELVDDYKSFGICFDDDVRIRRVTKGEFVATYAGTEGTGETEELAKENLVIELMGDDFYQECVALENATDREFKRGVA